MRFPAQKTFLAVSFMALSSTAAASSGTEPEGVLLDISVVDPKNDPESAIFQPSLDTGDSAKASSTPVKITPVPAASSAPATTAKAVAEPATRTPFVVEASASESVVSSGGKPVTIIPKDAVTAVKKSAAKEAATESKVASTVDRGTEVAAEVLGAITDAMRPKEQVPPLANDRLSFYLSEQVVYAQYERKSELFDLESARTHLGFLYSEQRDTILQGGLALDASFTKTFRLSFGTRAYAALLNQENEDAFAAALGAEAAYRLPFQALPLEFGASLYYAPDILTFGTADRTLDAQVDVTFPVRSQVSLFGGYRFLQIDTRPNDREVDNRLHLGVRWDFE